MDSDDLKRFLSGTKLLRPPKHLLATFGATRIEYHMVSSIDRMPGKTRLREGFVVSDKPAVLTPEALKDRFEGFGPDAERFRDWLDTRFADVLRALEYRFKNADQKTSVLSSSVQETAERIKSDLDGRDLASAALIECPDTAWSLALMSFTLEEAKRAFPTNVRDLESRGRFDADGGAGRRRRAEVEALFAKAAGDSEARRRLGHALREYGLFAEYEDRFLSLFQ